LRPPRLPSARLLAFLLPRVGAVASPAGGFDIWAQRGGRGLAPENSLAAFGRALALGVATLELDLVVSRDERIPIGHDLELDPAEVRTPDGRWLEPPGPAVHLLASLATRPAEDLGLLVVPWTVGEPARVRQRVERGVHRPITDRPDRLGAIPAAIAAPLPPAFR